MALWTPADLTDAPLGWYRTRDPNGVVADGDDVYDGSATTNWIDRSGNGKTLTKQGDPTYSANGLATGQSAVFLDGVDDAFAISTGLGYPSSIRPGAFAVIKSSGQFSGHTRLFSLNASGANDFSSNGCIPLHQESESSLVYWYDGFGTGVATTDGEVALVAGYPDTATTVTSAKNATAGGAARAFTTGITFDALALGRQSHSNGGFWRGHVAELVIVEGVLSTNDRQKLEGYLAWNNGQEALLPVGHPYKAAAPEISGGGASYTLTAAQGSISLTGQAVTLRAARKLTAAQGSISLTGRTVGLAVGRKLTVATGSFAVTGQSARLVLDRSLPAAAGSFNLTGQDANLVYGPAGTDYTLAAATGSFTLAGQAATLRAARRLAASAGSFALTWQDVVLKYGRKIAAAQGSFVLTGNDAGLIYTPVAGYTLTAEVGAFVLAGQPANLVFSHSPGFIDDVGGFDRRQAEHVKREKSKRLDREMLSDAIDRAFARIERNENLTYEQVEKAEAVIERIEASSEEIEKPDISQLIGMLDQIGKKLKKVEQDRAIARLKRFEDEMDEDSSMEALMLVA